MKKNAMKSVCVTVLLLVVCFFAWQQTTHSQAKVGIARVWEGKTSLAKADAYGKYLMETGVPQMKSGTGNLGIEVFRRDHPTMVEFMVISYWESREAIKKIVGEDIERAMQLPRDPEFLLEPSLTAAHYRILYSDTSKLR